MIMCIHYMFNHAYMYACKIQVHLKKPRKRKKSEPWMTQLVKAWANVNRKVRLRVQGLGLRV